MFLGEARRDTMLPSISSLKIQVANVVLSEDLQLYLLMHFWCLYISGSQPPNKGTTTGGNSSSWWMVSKQPLPGTFWGIVIMPHRAQPPSSCTSLQVSRCRLRTVAPPMSMVQTPLVAGPGSVVSCSVSPKLLKTQI